MISDRCSFVTWHYSDAWCKSAKSRRKRWWYDEIQAQCNHGGNAELHHAKIFSSPCSRDTVLLESLMLIYTFSLEPLQLRLWVDPLPFRAGRSDANGPSSPSSDSRFSPDGRLPDADGRGKGPGDHVRDIFYRMGYVVRLLLFGAHGLGRCPRSFGFLGTLDKSTHDLFHRVLSCLGGTQVVQEDDTQR